jgi:hypothetical protein
VEENFRKISYASGCVDEQRSVLVRWRSEEPKISHEKRSTNGRFCKKCRKNNF